MLNLKCSNQVKSKRGFTLVELVFVLAVIGILIGMLLPAVRRVREPARRTHCLNNLRQIILAVHNYESVYQQFPSAMGGDFFAKVAPEGNSERLSGLVAILPFIEQGDLWEQISNPSEFNGVAYPALPEPWLPDYEPWRQTIDTFVCPTDPVDYDADFTPTSYAFCIGDQARDIHNPVSLRGAFGCQLNTRFDDITDGASNTIGMAETCRVVSSKSNVGTPYATGEPASLLDNPSKCLELADGDGYRANVRLGSRRRGGSWADGSAGSTLFNTILPPDSPSALIGNQAIGDGFYSAGGVHPGTVNVAIMDGSTRSISREIDTGDLTQPTLTGQQLADGNSTPYGAWGKLGTISGGEVVDIDDF